MDARAAEAPVLTASGVDLSSIWSADMHRTVRGDRREIELRRNEIARVALGRNARASNAD
jgi:hypothetical protein